MSEVPERGTGRQAKQAAQADRLAKALRQNLQRRKQQDRAKQAGGKRGPGPTDGADPAA